jgi:hypothetical protein
MALSFSLMRTKINTGSKLPVATVADVLAGNPDDAGVLVAKLKLPPRVVEAPNVEVLEKPALAPDLFVELVRENVPNPAFDCVFASDWSVLAAGTPIPDANEKAAGVPVWEEEPVRLRPAPNFGIAPAFVEVGAPKPPAKENGEDVPEEEPAKLEAAAKLVSAGFEAGWVVPIPKRFLTAPCEDVLEGNAETDIKNKKKIK